MIIAFDAYHGTSQEARALILSEQRFLKSSDSTEWAGTGIYFFIEEDKKENAQKWAIYIKGFTPPEVVRANIEINVEFILDLTIKEHQKQFHRFRELYFKKAKESAESLGRAIDKNARYKLNLDCLTINTMCSDMEYHAVKRTCYIRFKSNGFWGNYPSSDIPNCTIFCLRDEGYIKAIC